MRQIAQPLQALGSLQCRLQSHCNLANTSLSPTAAEVEVSPSHPPTGGNEHDRLWSATCVSSTSFSKLQEKQEEVPTGKARFLKKVDGGR